MAAFHEAAHCIANLHFGVAINSVHIGQDGSGCCEREAPSNNDYVELICSLAGPLAEAAVAGKAKLGGDCRNYGTAAVLLPAADRAQAQRYAKALVQHQAGVLLSARYLDGAAVARIVFDNVNGAPAHVLRIAIMKV